MIRFVLMEIMVSTSIRSVSLGHPTLVHQLERQLGRVYRNSADVVKHRRNAMSQSTLF